VYYEVEYVLKEKVDVYLWEKEKMSTEFVVRGV
jgi:hypothetical protein